MIPHLISKESIDTPKTNPAKKKLESFGNQFLKEKPAESSHKERHVLLAFMFVLPEGVALLSLYCDNAIKNQTSKNLSAKIYA